MSGRNGLQDRINKAFNGLIKLVNVELEKALELQDYSSAFNFIEGNKLIKRLIQTREFVVEIEGWQDRTEQRRKLYSQEYLPTELTRPEIVQETGVASVSLQGFTPTAQIINGTRAFLKTTFVGAMLVGSNVATARLALDIMTKFQEVNFNVTGTDHTWPFEYCIAPDKGEVFKNVAEHMISNGYVDFDKFNWDISRGDVDEAKKINA